MFVNEQAVFHEKRMEHVGHDSFKASLHKGTAEKFRALASDIEETDKMLDVQPPEITQNVLSKVPLQLSLGIEELEGLPEELIKELSLSDGDKTEFAIINAIEEAGGVISLDRLLIALYKKTGEIYKRTPLTSRLARMANKNSIHYVPGKKGAYSIEQLSNEDVAKLFGAAKQQEQTS
jgi:hypothetical protein